MCEMLEEGKKGEKAGREGNSNITHTLRGPTLETAIARWEGQLRRTEGMEWESRQFHLNLHLHP